ncbi:MAG: helix-turn-helix transcriptional regulator [Verrucomicrobiota bacterium]
MSHTVGQRLAEARNKQGLSIEDVAHTTRIRPDTLRDMESDDYSNFPNLTYAKSFLSMYSSHLDVDVSEFIREFGPADSGSLDVMSFLDPVNGSSSSVSLNTPAPAPADSRSGAYSPMRSQSRGHPILFILILLGAVGAAYGMFLVAKNSSDDTDAAADDEVAKATNIPTAPAENNSDLPTNLPPSPFPNTANPDTTPDTTPETLPAEPITTPPSNDPPVIVRPAIIDDSDEDESSGTSDDAPRAVPFRPKKPE